MSKTQARAVCRAIDVMQKHVKLWPHKTWHLVILEFFLKYKAMKEVVSEIDIRLVPAQDIPYALIFWYVLENHLFILWIGPILNKDLEFVFRSDCSDCACFLVRYQYYWIYYIYINVTQNTLFFEYKNVTQSVWIFVSLNVT